MDIDLCRLLLGEDLVQCVDAEVLGGITSGVIKIAGGNDASNAGTLLLNKILASVVGKPHCEAECDPSVRQLVSMALLEDTEGRLLVTREHVYAVNSFGPFSLLVQKHLAYDDDSCAALYHLPRIFNFFNGEFVKSDLEGVVVCNDSAYDAAHIGILYRLRISGWVKERMKSITLIGKWMTYTGLLRLYREGALDSWSNIVFKHLAEGVPVSEGGCQNSTNASRERIYRTFLVRDSEEEGAFYA